MGGQDGHIAKAPSHAPFPDPFAEVGGQRGHTGQQHPKSLGL